jgi:hypothetical protein
MDLVPKTKGQVEAVTRAEPAARGQGSVGEEVDEDDVQGHRVGGANGADPEHQLGLGGEPQSLASADVGIPPSCGNYRILDPAL